MRIAVEGDTVEKLVQDLDGKENMFHSSVYLRRCRWVEQEPSGKYIITDKGTLCEYGYNKSFQSS